MWKRLRWNPGLRKWYSSSPDIRFPLEVSADVSTTDKKPPIQQIVAAGSQLSCEWSKDPHDIRNILCTGPILRAVQMSSVFPDCKTFVDMKVKTSVPVILDNWSLIEKQYASTKEIPMTAILSFLENHFETIDVDTELEKWVPKDWTPNPTIVDKIKAPEYKYFAKEVNNLWIKLARKMSPNVQTGKTTLIYMPNGFIIPGGRFRELYYWDTYFIMLGLLACEMFETAKGVLENLVFLLKNHGCIYNGSRLYYQFRTQPPMLLMMVNDYVEATKDFSMVRDNYSLFEKEIAHWEKTRKLELTINGDKYEMFRYNCCTPGPRPESYREDVATITNNDTPEQQMYKYRAISSACESGWDFSSRWFKCKKGASVVDMHTHEIVPVDLISFMDRNYYLLKRWAKELKLPNEITKYSAKSKKMRQTLQDLLWDDIEGMWFDLDTRDGQLNRQYSISNFTPLWTSSYNWDRKTEIAERMLYYYSKYNLWKYKGGLPTTMCFSGEQWDWPNAWAPLQLMASEGLRNVGLPMLAFNVANNWVNNNYLGYLKHNVIFEKYDCRRAGVTGFGGEYEEQYGFGWSNGVLLKFFQDYGNKLSPEESKIPKAPFSSTRELTPQEEKNLT